MFLSSVFQRKPSQRMLTRRVRAISMILKGSTQISADEVGPDDQDAMVGALQCVEDTTYPRVVGTILGFIHEATGEVADDDTIATVAEAVSDDLLEPDLGGLRPDVRDCLLGYLLSLAMDHGAPSRLVAAYVRDNAMFHDPTTLEDLEGHAAAVARMLARAG